MFKVTSKLLWLLLGESNFKNCLNVFDVNLKHYFRVILWGFLELLSWGEGGPLLEIFESTHIGNQVTK